MLLGVAPKPFASPDWAWEIKYDGYRVLAFREGPGARLMSRGGRDISAQFPEVVDALRALPRHAVIDGELTVPDADGSPDFNALRPRTMMSSPTRIWEAATRTPAILYAFDVLAIAGKDVRDKALVERRLTLSNLVVNGTALRCSELCDDGRGLFAAVTTRGLEGVVGKKLDSPYRAGRTKHWLKVRAPSARPQERR